jgi:16S rRNA (uracil1498-N3)-methyltransferase
MKVDEELLISDGEGKDYMCKIKSFSEDGILLSITDEVFEGTELASKIYLFQGLPKSDKMEFIIQKAVELGVYQIIPVATKRSVVKLDEKKAENKRKRWNAIAESAAKQSRRGIVPEVTQVMSFKEAIAYSQEFAYRFIPYENFKDMKSTRELLDSIGGETKPCNIGIYIGPEGGFEETEVEYGIEQGVHPISLGRRILRTETAGLMLCSVLMYKLED